MNNLTNSKILFNQSTKRIKDALYPKYKKNNFLKGTKKLEKNISVYCIIIPVFGVV